MLKNFVLEMKNKETGAKVYKRIPAMNIIGHCASYGVDYTDILNSYTRKNFTDMQLMYWEIEEFYGKLETITIKLDENEVGTLELKTRDLICTFEVEDYTIKHISDWVIEEYPVYETIDMLDSLNRMRDENNLQIIKNFQSVIAVNEDNTYSIINFKGIM